MNMTREVLMDKRRNHLRVLLLQYVQSVLEMVNSADGKNINQIVSLIKANIKVLENDVQQSFRKHETQDFNYRDYN